MIRSAIILCILLIPAALRCEGLYRVEHITPEQGLSQSIVYAVFQDSRGLLWFGTRDGLNMFDGLRFTHFRHQPHDASSLLANAALDIGEDRDGNIWVSLGPWGIARLDRRTYQFQRYPLDDLKRRSLRGGDVRALLKDPRGGIVIGTDSGLFRFDPMEGRCERIIYETGAARGGVEYITSLYHDRRGFLWIGTMGTRFYRYDWRRGEALSFPTIQPGVEGMRFIGEDARGYLYMATDKWFPTSPCLWRINPVDGAVVGELTVLRSGYVVPYRVNDGKNIWIWIQEGNPVSNSLYSIPFDDGEIRIDLDSAYREVRIRGEVREAIVDRSGITWVGAIDGIYKLTPTGMRFITYRNVPGDPYSLSNDRIRAIHLDRMGRLWVGTDMGLNRLDPGSRQWRRYRANTFDLHKLPNDRVNTILEEPDGTLMMGTNGGVAIYNPTLDIFSRKEYLPARDTLYGPAIWSLRRDGEGRLWVGTRSDGIFIYDRTPRLVKRLRHDPRDPGSLANGIVWTMYDDRAGRLWVGTDRGLCRWIPERNAFKVYRNDPGNPGSLGFDNVCAITEDIHGNLWLGTQGGGISRYNPSTDDFTTITSREGLPDNTAYGLLGDRLGRLWISSNAGLTVYDPAAHTFRTYTVRDGLAGNEFSFRSFHKTSDGEFLFGGVDGLTRFRPEELHADAIPPPVMITSFKVFDRAVYHQLSDGEVIEIPYDNNFIAFEFVALDYTDPDGIRYAYRLEGFDRDWIYCGNRRYASFTNLDPGSYTFHVKGGNTDGAWNTRGMRVTVRVIPPFWMTLWFKLLSAGVILAAATAAVVLRTRSIRSKYLLMRRSAESQLQALRLQMNPHFIFNSLGSIQHLIMTGQSDRAMEYLARFARLVRCVLENSRREYIPLAEEIETLTLYLDLEAHRFDERFAYRFDIDPALDPLHTRIPSMLIQPLVENAIRHGLRHKNGDGLITITLARRGSDIQCIIEDNGVGREGAREAHPGDRRPIGMSVTAERLQILNAGRSRDISMRVIDLLDAGGNGAGTRVEISIPMESSVAEYSLQENVH